MCQEIFSYFVAKMTMLDIFKPPVKHQILSEGSIKIYVGKFCMPVM